MIDFTPYIQSTWSWTILFVMALSIRMPKLAFVGTNAWFFLCVNYLKLPLQIFAWHRIRVGTISFS